MAIRQTCLIGFCATIGLGADINSYGITQYSRAPVIVANHDGFILGKGIGQQIFPAPNGGQSRAIGGGIELTKDVGFTLVRP